MKLEENSNLNFQLLSLQNSNQKKNAKLNPPSADRALLTLCSYLTKPKDLLRFASLTKFRHQLKGDPRFWTLLAKSLKINLVTIGSGGERLPFQELSTIYRNNLKSSMSVRRIMESGQLDNCSAQLKGDLKQLCSGSFDLAFVQSFKQRYFPGMMLSDHDLGNIIITFATTLFYSPLNEQLSLLKRAIDALKGNDLDVKLIKLKELSSLDLSASAFKDLLKQKKQIILPGNVKLILRNLPTEVLKPLVVKGNQNIDMDDMIGVIKSSLDLQKDEKFSFSINGIGKDACVNFDINSSNQIFSMTVSCPMVLQIASDNRNVKLPLSELLRQMLALNLKSFPIHPKSPITFTGIEIEKFKSRFEEVENKSSNTKTLIHVFWEIIQQTAKEISPQNSPAVLLALEGSHKISVDKEQKSFSLTVEKESRIAFNVPTTFNIEEKGVLREEKTFTSGVFMFEIGEKELIRIGNSSHA